MKDEWVRDEAGMSKGWSMNEQGMKDEWVRDKAWMSKGWSMNE